MEFGPILRSMARNKVRYGLIVLEIALTLAIVTNPSATSAASTSTSTHSLTLWIGRAESIPSSCASTRPATNRSASSRSAVRFDYDGCEAAEFEAGASHDPDGRASARASIGVFR